MEDPKLPTEFVLSADTINNVLAYLGTQQHRLVANLIGQIHYELAPQLPAPKAEKPKQAEEDTKAPELKIAKPKAAKAK